MEENSAVKAYQPVSIMSWMISMILVAIPLVNIIMLLIWSFSKNTPESKANWAKASLMFILLIIAFYVIAVFGIGMMASPY